MLKVKRTIYIDEQAIEIWLGLVNKNGKFTVYLLTDSPSNPFNHADKILSGSASKDDAIKQGVMYARKAFRDILKNRDVTND